MGGGGIEPPFWGTLGATGFPAAHDLTSNFVPDPPSHPNPTVRPVATTLFMLTATVPLIAMMISMLIFTDWRARTTRETRATGIAPLR